MRIAVLRDSTSPHGLKWRGIVPFWYFSNAPAVATQRKDALRIVRQAQACRMGGRQVEGGLRQRLDHPLGMGR